MARVPTIVQNEQRLQPISNARFEAQDGTAVGRAIGGGLQQAGQALGQAAVAQDQINATYDAARAKAIDNQFVEKLRGIEYGDAGFYTTKNGDTVNASRPTRDAIEGAYSAALNQAQTPRERQMLSDVLARRRASSLEGIDRYTQAQQQSFALDTSKSRMVLAQDGFVRAGGAGLDAEENLATVRSEVRQQADMEGLTDANAVRARELEAVSRARVAVVQSLATSDPEAAARYRQQHASEITADQGVDIDRQLYRPLLERQASSDLDGYLGGPVARDTPRNAQPSPSSPAATVASKIIGVESGGNASARNPMPGQSASGLGQFTDKTWLNLYRQKMPNATGLSDADILRLKTDPAVGRRMTELAVQEHVGLLQDAGLPATDGNIYLSHFLGPTAVKVLKAAPNTPISELVPPAFIRANPKVLGGGATVADVCGWCDKKMGGGGVRASYAPTAGDRETMYGWIDGHDDWSFDRKAAAREEADRRIGRGEAVKRANEDTAKDTALETVMSMGENFTSVTQIPSAALVKMSPETRMQFMGWAKQNSTRGEKPPTTDASKWSTISDAYASDPKAFIEIRPEQVRGFLDDGDFNTYLGWRRDVLQSTRTGGNGKTPQWTTERDIMDVSKSLMTAAGIRVGDSKEAIKDAPRVAQFNRTMLDWSRGFKEQNKRLPDSEEIRRQADRYLIEGSWKGPDGKGSGYLFESPGGVVGLEVPNDVRRRILAAAPNATEDEIGRIYIRNKGTKW